MGWREQAVRDVEAFERGNAPDEELEKARRALAWFRATYPALVELWEKSDRTPFDEVAGGGIEPPTSPL